MAVLQGYLYKSSINLIYSECLSLLTLNLEFVRCYEFISGMTGRVVVAGWYLSAEMLDPGCRTTNSQLSNF